MAGIRRSSSRKLVSTITRAAGTRSRSSRIAPTPSSFGITRSMRITSGVSSSASGSASSPSPASPTTSRPSCNSRNVRSPSRTTAWSSTISTLIGSSANRRLQLHGGPLAALGLDLDPRADPLRPLLHRREPQPSRAQIGSVGVEAHAVVGHLEEHVAVLLRKSHMYVARLRVSQGVLQSLLRDAEQLAVAGGVALDLRVHVEVDLPGSRLQTPQHLHVLAQRATKTVAFEVRWPELEDQRSQLVERLLSQQLELLHLLAGGVLVAVEQLPSGLGGQHQAEQPLAHGVVQLERQPVALRQRGQLAAALVQPRVDDRDRSVRGQQLDQLLVGVGEVLRPDLLGEIEGADHPLASDNRHAQERPHVGVSLRPPAPEARMLVHVGRAVRVGRVEHGAEHPVLPRQRTERLDQLVTHPRGEELAEAALPVGQPECRITGVSELPRGVHEPLKDFFHRPLRSDGENSITDRTQRGRKRLAHGRTVAPTGGEFPTWMTSPMTCMVNHIQVTGRSRNWPAASTESLLFGSCTSSDSGAEPSSGGSTSGAFIRCTSAYTPSVTASSNGAVSSLLLFWPTGPRPF